MRIPIQFALSYPSAGTRRSRRSTSRSWARSSSLRPTPTRSAVGAGPRGLASAAALPCAMNAANEVAVAAFLAEEGTYLGIAACVEAVMDAHDVQPVESLEQLEAVDAWARTKAREWIAGR
ncbi:MAG: hypothetical protein ACLVKI_05655 [Gordonibacter urolithinfaciens]